MVRSSCSEFTDAVVGKGSWGLELDEQGLQIQSWAGYEDAVMEKGS